MVTSDSLRSTLYEYTFSGLIDLVLMPVCLSQIYLSHL